MYVYMYLYVCMYLPLRSVLSMQYLVHSLLSNDISISSSNSYMAIHTYLHIPTYIDVCCQGDCPFTPAPPIPHIVCH